MIRKLSMVAALAVLGTSGAAVAQSSSQTTTGSTRIVQPISLAKDFDLSFGSIIKPASAGTSTITMPTNSDTPTVGAGGAALAGGGATRKRAAYTVTGEGGQGYSITVPASFTMNRTTPSGGTTPITVTLTASKTTGSLGNALGSQGTDTFFVGGNFDVSNTTESGDYSGTFNVTVQYN